VSELTVTLDEGTPLALHLAEQAFEAEGLTVDYEPPLEQRGGGQPVFEQVLINLACDATFAVLFALAKKAQAKLAERKPPVVIHLPPVPDEQESWGSE
jgi:hypothetical protein